MTDSPRSALRIRRLLELHGRLDELFLFHQELLLQGDLTRARDVLDAHRSFFELHVEHEERLLLPLYAGFAAPRRFSVELYTGQHRKMRSLLLGARRRLESIDETGRPMRRQLLALLDYETTYKHLAEHHDGAERTGLFTVLEIFLEATRQEALTRRCLDEWDRLEEALLHRVLSGPEEVPCTLR